MPDIYRVVYIRPFPDEAPLDTAVREIVKMLLSPIDNDPDRYIVPDIDEMEENIQESVYNTTMDNYDKLVCKNDCEKAFTYARRLAENFPGDEIFIPYWGGVV